MIDIIQCFYPYFRNVSATSSPSSVKIQLNITHELLYETLLPAIDDMFDLFSCAHPGTAPCNFFYKK